MSICVTGATGLAGGHVARLLVERGDGMRFADRLGLPWGVGTAERYVGRRPVAGR